MPRPTSADPTGSPSSTVLVERAGKVGPRVADRLAFAAWLASATPPMAVGSAAAALGVLTAVATADVALARTVEPHLDARAILAQAGSDLPAGTTWGVFAAEAPGTRLEASPEDADGQVLLSGRKPWCSLASSLSHALVTAHTGDDRYLVAVDLRHPGVRPHDEAWVARGLPDVPSGPVDFDAVPGRRVGPAGWYTSRPGFAWGGIGVAACWYGGAVGLARLLRSVAGSRPDSELLQVALGATVLDLATAADALDVAGRRIDDEAETDWALLAQTVRSRVAAAAERVRGRVLATVGPGPMTSDGAVAARAADLELYLRQDHGDRDVARVGRMVTAGGGLPW